MSINASTTLRFTLMQAFYTAKPVNFESFPHIVIRRRQCVTIPSVGKNGKPCFTSLLREKEG